MDIKEIVKSQYLAALEMLKQAVVKCPDSVWNAPEDKNKFWHLAYHALFYTHLYLQGREEDFLAWENHRKDYQFLGPVPWPPHNLPEIGDPYTRDEVLAYLARVQGQVEERLPALDLEAGSGFSWLPFSKFELQLYNIRHLQQHTGELYERLGHRSRIELGWVSRTPEYLKTMGTRKEPE